LALELISSFDIFQKFMSQTIEKIYRRIDSVDFLRGFGDGHYAD
jgi:hypothetical protein